MKRVLPLLLVAELTACRSSQPPKQGANMPTVEDLAPDPERLKELRRQGKTECLTTGDALGIAWSKRRTTASSAAAR